MRIKRTKPMSIKRINMLLSDFSDYSLEEEDNGQIVMVKSEDDNKQVQPNLLKHLMVE